MAHFFQFESDFVDSLRCIPMEVRLKLDTCGVKLKLPHWHQFNPEERQTLVDLPCTTQSEVPAYREQLYKLVLRTGDTPADLPIESHPAWLDERTIPESVQNKAQECGISLSLEQWSQLMPVQRFALIKLSRSSHENRNFLPALKEFQLV